METYENSIWLVRNYKKSSIQTFQEKTLQVSDKLSIIPKYLDEI